MKDTITRMHMSAHWTYIVQEIQRHGASNVLQDYSGTDEEALAAIREDGREWYTMGQCDNQKPDGSCAGHPMTEAEREELRAEGFFGS